MSSSLPSLDLALGVFHWKMFDCCHDHYDCVGTLSMGCLLLLWLDQSSVEADAVPNCKEVLYLLLSASGPNIWHGNER